MGSSASAPTSTRTNNTADESQRSAKIVLCGDRAVGKTALYQRLILGSPLASYEPSEETRIGARLISHTFRGKALKAHIWDTPGKQLTDLPTISFAGVDVVVIILDSAREQWDARLKEYIKYVQAISKARTAFLRKLQSVVLDPHKFSTMLNESSSNNTKTPDNTSRLKLKSTGRTSRHISDNLVQTLERRSMLKNVDMTLVGQIPIIIAFNRVDKLSERPDVLHDLQTHADAISLEYGASTLFTSCNDGFGVAELLDEIARNIVQRPCLYKFMRRSTCKLLGFNTWQDMYQALHEDEIKACYSLHNPNVEADDSAVYGSASEEKNSKSDDAIEPSTTINSMLDATPEGGFGPADHGRSRSNSTESNSIKQIRQFDTYPEQMHSTTAYTTSAHRTEYTSNQVAASPSENTTEPVSLARPTSSRSLNQGHVEEADTNYQGTHVGNTTTESDVHVLPVQTNSSTALEEISDTDISPSNDAVASAYEHRVEADLVNSSDQDTYDEYNDVTRNDETWKHGNSTEHDAMWKHRGATEHNGTWKHSGVTENDETWKHNGMTENDETWKHRDSTEHDGTWEHSGMAENDEMWEHGDSAEHDGTWEHNGVTENDETWKHSGVTENDRALKHGEATKHDGTWEYSGVADDDKCEHDEASEPDKTLEYYEITENGKIWKHGEATENDEMWEYDKAIEHSVAPKNSQATENDETTKNATNNTEFDGYSESYEHAQYKGDYETNEQEIEYYSTDASSIGTKKPNMDEYNDGMGSYRNHDTYDDGILGTQDKDTMETFPPNMIVTSGDDAIRTPPAAASTDSPDSVMFEWGT